MADHEVVDQTTFMADRECKAKSVIGFVADDAPQALSHLVLTGRWNHGAEDELKIMLAPAAARAVARLLLESATAAEDDLRRYLEGEFGVAGDDE